ncbi:MAG TPA: lipase family protein [Candidatus Cybelea sp.]|nr:lipase family protein [Candidatus Cybelea sp.]
MFALMLVAAVTASAAAQGIPAGPAGSAFYQPPATLPSNDEGTVIRAQPFSDGAALPSASKNYRVLYESTMPNGALVAVSGTVALPPGTPPSAGWPLISWAHGTVGNAPQCAPSRSAAPNVEQRMLDGFVRRGYAVAQTDYDGNGTPGIHPYMVATVAAHDVTDMAIAARAVDPRIGRAWVVMGHSEGGAAALATASIAHQIAPDLNLVGVVAFAPYAFPESTLRYEIHNDAPNEGLVILGLLVDGFSTVDSRIVPSQMLEPQAMRLMPELGQECVSELMQHSDWANMPPDRFFRPQAESAIDALYGDLVENDAAYFSIAVPTLLVQGVADVQVSSESTMTVGEHLRRHGTPVDFKAYVGATHGSVLSASSSDVAAWIAQRFAQTERPAAR